MGTWSIYCCASENGSITAELLVGMLAHMDKTGIFAWDTGPPAPFLILEGHGSRFDLLFLEYINNPEHNWSVCIGVPYGTLYWQVGDSTEQNGCYKMAITKAKRELLTKKADHRQEFSLNKVDIVGIVSTAWDESFGQVTSNRTAIANRGWGPLNYNVLHHHSEIQLTKITLQNGTQKNTANATSPQELNLSDHGFARTLVDRVVEYRNREDARNGIDLDAQARQCKETAQAHLDSHKKRISASLLASAGIHALGTNVLASAWERPHTEETPAGASRRARS